MENRYLGSEPKILHYPTETDITYEQHRESFPTIRNSILNNALDKCWKNNPDYPGSIVITDIRMWDRLINNNKENKEFNRRAYGLYQQHVLYQNYLTLSAKNIDASNQSMSWDEYLVSVGKPK